MSLSYHPSAQTRQKFGGTVLDLLGHLVGWAGEAQRQIRHTGFHKRVNFFQALIRRAKGAVAIDNRVEGLVVAS
jgi:hypothetical protein